ncbi:MAG: hypothetical protein ACXW2D_15085, partial [Burkholderiaceae bacterium]
MKHLVSAITLLATVAPIGCTNRHELDDGIVVAGCPGIRASVAREGDALLVGQIVRELAGISNRDAAIPY